jgi:proteasome lid subunit RPN8/RPN11
MDNTVSDSDSHTPKKKRFEIAELAAGFTIENQDEPVDNPDVIPFTTQEVAQGVRRSIFLSSTAAESIFSHIGWGMDTSQNQVEQGGLLLGTPFMDTRTGVTWAITKSVTPALSAKGSMSALEFPHECWRDFFGELDAINAGQDLALQVVGWYHTHPRHLKVFMSATDQATQRRFFREDWQFALVLNPQSRMLRAFNGIDAQPCRGYICSSAGRDFTKLIPPQ